MTSQIFREIHDFKSRCSDDKCIRPFCYCLGNTPKELRLCGGCFNDLVKIMGGANNIYDYKSSPPKLKMTMKQAMELLLVNNLGCQNQGFLKVDVNVITKHRIEQPESQKEQCLTVEKGDEHV